MDTRLAMSFQILPPKRPQLDRDTAASQMRDAGWDEQRHPVALYGVRGYYKNTMGERGANDRKLYDDAIFLISPDKFHAFNANTDPGAFRAGIATLMPGVWLYHIGTHGLSKPKKKRYTAFVQAAPVTVQRDGRTMTYSGMFGINIHRGGRFSVSSEGCQTIWPGQWEECIANASIYLRERGQEVIPYILVDE
jgi:lysozyme